MILAIATITALAVWFAETMPTTHFEQKERPL